MDAVLSSPSAWVWRDAITAVFWLAVAALAIGTARRAALWRTGLAAPVAWRGLLAIPKRYFVDLHHVVAREPAVARAHVAVAGGAIACLALVAINDGLRLRQWIEDETDRRTTLPWERYGADATVALAEALEPPCERLLVRVDVTAGERYQPASRDRPRRQPAG